MTHGASRLRHSLVSLLLITIPLTSRTLAFGADKGSATLQVTVTASDQQQKPASSSPQSAIRNPNSAIEPLPCRVQLSANDKPIYAPGCPRWERDADFCCDGKFTVEVPAAKIELLVERGPEWESHRETFEVAAATTRTVAVALSRWIDMNARGWYGGDLHVHRPPADMPLLLRAEDLNVAPVLTRWNEKKLDAPPPYLVEIHDSGADSSRPRFFHTMNQEDERNGGAILMFNLPRPVVLKNVYRFWPTGMAFQRAALAQEVGQVANLSNGEQSHGASGQVANPSHSLVHIEQEKPFWWEAPVNIALGKISTMEIVHNHFQRRGMMEDEAWGHPRDREEYAGPAGFCFYTLDLYYRYLNLGWDIPASAGSASGVLANPVGYNRVYVQMDRFSYDGWFEALRAGRSFATNGPMLFVTVNGQPAGTHFDAKAGQPFEAVVRLEALSREPLDSAQVVVGGKVVATFRPADDNRKRVAAEHPLSLARSTWIAVRVFEKFEPTVRFAHTSPFYVTIGGEKRRDPKAAQSFVQWMDDLIADTERIRERFQTAAQLAETLETYKQAREVYAKLAGPSPSTQEK